MARHRLGSTALLLVPVIAVACTPTARTAGPYHAKAIKAAQAIQSSVGTDALVLRQAVARRTTAAFMSVATTDAEDAASAAASTFLSIQPPDAGSERLRDAFSDLADDANAGLADARIAARDGDGPALRRAGARLKRLRDQIARFLAEHP